MALTEKISRDILVTNITQITLRVLAAMRGLKSIRLAVLGDLSVISETGEVLSDDSRVKIMPTYFNEHGSSFYQKGYEYFDLKNFDCVFVITKDKASEEKIFSALKISKSCSANTVVISLSTYLNSVITTLNSFQSLPSCLNYAKLFSIAAALFLSRPEGIVLECGVFFGGTTAFIGRLQKALGINRQIFAFDTFTGLPAPSNKDIEAGGSVYPAGFFNETSLQQVQRLIRESDLADNVRLFPGLVQDTLPEALRGNHSVFAFLDMDQYEGTYQALKTILSLQPNNLFAIIDDTTIPGVDQAINDACRGLPIVRSNISYNFDLISLGRN